MSAAPSKTSTPTQGLTAEQAAAAAAPGFDETLHSIWRDNSKLILGGCGAVLAVILGWGAWGYYQGQQELGIQKEFEQATTADQWKRFAGAHPGHVLAGVAQLSAADDLYEKGTYADAEGAYQAAIVVLPAGAVKQRAQLGLAMAKIGAGKSADGEAILKQMADDTSVLKGLRAEAAYHVASLAAEAGRNDDVSKYADKVMQVDLDSSGPWLSRALALKIKTPVAGSAPGSSPGLGIPSSLAAPSAQQPAAPKDPGPSIKLPGN